MPLAKGALRTVDKTFWRGASLYSRCGGTHRYCADGERRTTLAAPSSPACKRSSRRASDVQDLPQNARHYLTA